MKNPFLHILTFISAKFCFSALMLLWISQSISYGQIQVYNEELYVQTDRDFYISGEKVYLKIFCLNRLTQKPSALSKVVYVSLLDSLNDPVVQAKIGINGFTGSGIIILPEEIGTGNYYIASCTRWMQNFSPDMFSYKAISVLNPFVDPGKSGKKITGSDPDTMTFKNSIDIARGLTANILPGFDLSVKPGKAVYPAREKIRIEIAATDTDGNPVISNLMVSVVKSFSLGRNNNSINSLIQFPGDAAMDYTKDQTVNNVPDAGPVYLPEPEGYLTSGKIHNTVTGEPLKNENIVLSFVGKTAKCRFAKTDIYGRFYFKVNETGNHEIVIQPLNPELTDFYVELDNPFPVVYSENKPDPLLIDTGRLAEINSAIISMQVQSLYEPLQLSGTEDREKILINDFYGKPDLKILLATYIELSSLKEIIKELVPGVITFNRKDRSDFGIYSYPLQTTVMIPLVLVDGVPVHDHDAVLKMNPAEIEKIEVLYSRYFISDMLFEGIVDITTYDGNLSAFTFDKPVFRQEFETLQPVSVFRSPDYSSASEKKSRIPDFRNTLYWNPEIITDNHGRAVVEFYSSDEPGSYKVLVEGLTIQGKKGSAEAAFSVSDK